MALLPSNRPDVFFPLCGPAVQVSITPYSSTPEPDINVGYFGREGIAQEQKNKNSDEFFHFLIVSFHC